MRHRLSAVAERSSHTLLFHIIVSTQIHRLSRSKRFSHAVVLGEVKAGDVAEVAQESCRTFQAAMVCAETSRAGQGKKGRRAAETVG